MARELERIRTDRLYAMAWFIGLVASLAIVQLLGTAIARMGYPYALEWMEPGVLDHVRTVLSDRPLYRQPSLEWTPFIYTPFYYWVSAVFVKVLGVGLFPLRLVSFLSILAILGFIGAFVRREAGGVLGPLVAVGLFAATFRVTGFWIDLARVDALFMALLLGGAYLARFAAGPRTAAATGLLLFLAFFTKQSALVLAVPILAAMVAIDRRRGLVACAVFGALMVGSIQWMDLHSNRWFRYYVFEVPSKHPHPEFSEWREFFERATWRPMPFGLALAVVALFSGVLREKPAGRAVVFFYVGALIAAWFHGFSGLLHDGGFDNALIPYCAVVAVMAGIGVAWIVRSRPEVRRLQACGLFVVLLELGHLAFDQRAAIPRRRDLRAGVLVEDRLRSLKGEILSPAFGYYAYRAGHEETHAPSMALADIFKTNDREMIAALTADMVRAVQSGRFQWIVWDESMMFLPETFRTAIKQRYSIRSRLLDGTDPTALVPRTGFGARPNDVYGR